MQLFWFALIINYSYLQWVLAGMWGTSAPLAFIKVYFPPSPVDKYGGNLS